jgi:hypothetical protein
VLDRKVQLRQELPDVVPQIGTNDVNRAHAVALDTTTAAKDSRIAFKFPLIAPRHRSGVVLLYSHLSLVRPALITALATYPTRIFNFLLSNCDRDIDDEYITAVLDPRRASRGQLRLPPCLPYLLPSSTAVNCRTCRGISGRASIHDF